jgi:hypothetical protein
MLAVMGLGCTMIRAEIGFTLAFEPEKSQLLLTGWMATPKGLLLDLTHSMD